MTEKLSAFYTKYQQHFLPFILAVVLNSALYSIYGIGFFSPENAASILLCSLAYLLGMYSTKHKVVGGLSITLFSLVGVFLFFTLIMGSDWGESFRRWFLTGAEKGTGTIQFKSALLAVFPLFFSLAVYYFSIIQYKASFLLLVSLIPCVIYIKVLSDISNVYISIITVLNIAILISSQYRKYNKELKISGKLSILITIGAFLFVLLCAASLVPKAEEARFYSRFEALFMDGNPNGILPPRYSSMSDYSGNADNYRNSLNRRMYSVYGENVPYMKRQTFDLYDYENDRWYSLDEYRQGKYSPEEWNQMQFAQSLSKLRQATLAAAEKSSDFAKSYGVPEICAAPAFTDSMNVLYVMPENFAAVYRICPSRTMTIDPAGGLMVSEGGVFFNEEQPFGSYYRVDCYDEYEGREAWLSAGGADFNNEQSEKFLSDMSSLLEGDSTAVSATAKSYLEMHERAMEYSDKCQENTALASDEIRELALEITKDYSYDYEKADALQRYFLSNGFVYDLEFIAKDTSPEYFLFESRTGSCSDYASAFVLLARCAGLTARYCEGYIPQEGSRTQWTIDDNDSHAYPEVYIQNTGWLVYEPTVPSLYLLQNQGTQNNIFAGLGDMSIDYGLAGTVATGFAVFIVLILAVIFLLPFAGEVIFRLRLGFADNAGSVRMMYGRLYAASGYGAGFTPLEFGEKVEEEKDCSVRTVCEMIEKSSYAENALNEENKKAAYKEYTAAIRKIRKNRK